MFLPGYGAVMTVARLVPFAKARPTKKSTGLIDMTQAALTCHPLRRYHHYQIFDLQQCERQDNGGEAGHDAS